VYIVDTKPTAMIVTHVGNSVAKNWYQLNFSWK